MYKYTISLILFIFIVTGFITTTPLMAGNGVIIGNGGEIICTNGATIDLPPDLKQKLIVTCDGVNGYCVCECNIHGDCPNYNNNDLIKGNILVDEDCTLNIDRATIKGNIEVLEYGELNLTNYTLKGNVSCKDDYSVNVDVIRQDESGNFDKSCGELGSASPPDRCRTR